MNFEHCLKKVDKVTFDNKKYACTFKKLFCDLASDLVANLPSNKFGMSSVRNCYQIILDMLPFKIKVSNFTGDFALKLLKDMNIDKSSSIGANMLAKPISNNMQYFHKMFYFPNRLPHYQIKTITEIVFHETF